MTRLFNGFGFEAGSSRLVGEQIDGSFLWVAK